MPVVVFLSSVISVLYYLGIMQIVILKLAWIMQRTMGTTAAESVNAAGNIFIGQVRVRVRVRVWPGARRARSLVCKPIVRSHHTHDDMLLADGIAAADSTND